MPAIAIMVATVGTVVQLLKSWIAKLGYVVEGAVAVALTIATSAGVVAYYAIQTGQQFNQALFWVFIQVAFGALGAYKLIKGLTGTFKYYDSAGRVLPTKKDN